MSLIIAVIEPANASELYPLPIVAESAEAARRAAAAYLADAHAEPLPDLTDDDAVSEWLTRIYDDYDDSVHIYTPGEGDPFNYIDARTAEIPS